MLGTYRSGRPQACRQAPAQSSGWADRPCCSIRGFRVISEASGRVMLRLETPAYETCAHNAWHHCQAQQPFDLPR